MIKYWYVILIVTTVNFIFIVIVIITVYVILDQIIYDQMDTCIAT